MHLNQVGVKKTVEAGVDIEGIVAKKGLEFNYNREWGTEKEQEISQTDSLTVARSASETITEALKFSIGEQGEEVGSYRLSYVTTCDVYYFVTTNRDNTALKELEMIFCSRSSGQFMIEYSVDGEFGKTSDSAKLDWPDGFYRNFEIPTSSSSFEITFDVAGGYELVQKSKTVEFGKAYELPVPQRNNYAFEGWFDSLEGKENVTLIITGNQLKIGLSLRIGKCTHAG